MGECVSQELFGFWEAEGRNPGLDDNPVEV
jgi:hypothetical protein